MLPFWRTPLLSFSWPLWTAVAVTFVVGSFVAWVAGRGRYRLLVAISGQAVSTSEQLSPSEVIMMMVGFFVAQSSPIRNDLWSCVFLFSSLLLAGFMVCNLYSGGLATVMTVPQYEKSIDTVIDFAESGIQWFGPTPYCLEAINNATEPHLRQIRSTFKVASTLEAQRHAHAVDGGFIIEQAQHGHFAPSDFLDLESSTKFQILREDIYFEYCIALMTKTNPLRNSLNEHILQVQQSGMLYHWGTVSASRYLSTDVLRNIEQARLHRNDAGQAVTLQIDHFLGVLLRAIVLKYFSQYYSFCTIGRDFLQNVPVAKILLTDDDDLEAKLIYAIDNGCQAFVVDEPGIARFLDLYIPLHVTAEQRSMDKRMILLVTERNREEVLDYLVTHEALRGEAHCLVSGETFQFRTNAFFSLKRYSMCL
uniref:Ionotropic glutamate receptor C-terminal domain-containing protein n=1 Tax=Anopheles atroparvus TaxID=41427 RepID=A0A182JBJ4_ANOAO